MKTKIMRLEFEEKNMKLDLHNKEKNIELDLQRKKDDVELERKRKEIDIEIERTTKDTHMKIDLALKLNSARLQLSKKGARSKSAMKAEEHLSDVEKQIFCFSGSTPLFSSSESTSGDAEKDQPGIVPDPTPEGNNTEDGTDAVPPPSSNSMNGKRIRQPKGMNRLVTKNDEGVQKMLRDIEGKQKRTRIQVNYFLTDAPPKPVQKVSNRFDDPAFVSMTALKTATAAICPPVSDDRPAMEALFNAQERFKNANEDCDKDKNNYQEEAQEPTQAPCEEVRTEPAPFVDGPYPEGYEHPGRPSYLTSLFASVNVAV